MDLVGPAVVGWGIGKVGDAALANIWGRGPKNALKTALSIALQRFREIHPRVHQGLFEQPAFWDAMWEEMELLLQADTQPDARRLAQRVEPLPALSINRLERALEDLFRMIKQECRRHPDLMAIEQFRIAFDVKDQLQELVERLGFDPDIEETATKAQVAARVDLEKFSSFLGVSSTNPELGLSISKEQSAARPESFRWPDLLSALQQADAITLEAEPGGGKTTTLLGLAARLLDDGFVPIFVALPDQEATDLNILDGIVRRDAFSEQLTLRHLQALARHGRLVLLIDGWNELSSSARSRVRRILEGFRRDYPNVGLVLATRPDVARPTFPRSFSLRLDRLTADQRTAIIQERLEEQADSLCERIARSPNLDEITRIPLYLHALLKLPDEETLPETREGLLRAFVKVHEERPEHHGRLREELFGCHRAYLEKLAIMLVADGSTALPEADARRAVAKVSHTLRGDGQIAAEPQPQIVLEVLAAHHLLLMYGAGEAPSCRFQHHQFQEWYASLHVESLVRRAALDRDLAALSQLCANVIDLPRWEQALLFAAERLSQIQETGVEAVARLVEWCLAIDPLLAAEIINRCKENVWMNAAPVVIKFVERWHEPGRLDRAIAFMIASGRPEFADSVWILIAHQDRQVRLGATRSFRPFRTTVLGLDWKARLAAEEEEIRRDVLGEIAFFGGAEGLEIATDAAKDDPSDTIRLELLEAARFEGRYSHVARLVECAPLSFLRVFAPKAEAADLVNADFRARVIETLHEMVASELRPIGRLRLLLKLYELGDDTTFDVMFNEVERLEEVKGGDRWAPYYLLKQCSQLDPDRTSTALVRRLAAGQTIGSGWDGFVFQATAEDRQRIAEGILNGVRRSNELEPVAKILSVVEIGQLIVQLLSKLDQIKAQQPPHARDLTEPYNDLLRLLQSCQFPELAEAIVEMPAVSNVTHAGVLAKILSGHGGREKSEQRLLIPDNLLGRLRECLRAWIVLIQSSADGRRWQLADIGITLGRLGQREDLPLLTQLLEEDLGRRRRDRDAWLAGGRRQPGPPELHTSYVNQYRQAFEAMPSAGVAVAVAPYLSHPDFAAEAAFILRHIWVREHGSSDQEKNWQRWPDYSGVREQFAIRQSSDKRTPAHPLAAAILDRMEELLPASGDIAIRSILFKFANAVADMEYGDRLSVILRVSELEGTHDSKRACFIKLAQKGERLNAAPVRDACEAALLAWQRDDWQRDQNWWMLEEWLEVLAFSTEPAALLEIIEGLTPKQRPKPWSIRRLLRALQYTPAPGADLVAINLPKLIPGLDEDIEWLEAVVAHDSEAVLEACQKILWDSSRVATIAHHTPSGEIFVKRLAHLFRTNRAGRADLFGKLETQLPVPVQRLLAHVFVDMADDDEVWAAALLMLSNVQRPDGHIYKMIERRVTAEVPVEGLASTVEIVPRSAAPLRRRLFEMLLNDPQRDQAARRMLVRIDELRDEHGRPDDEPRHPWLASEVPWPLVETPPTLKAP